MCMILILLIPSLQGGPARYTFGHDRGTHSVDHSADDAAQHAVSVDGVSDGVPALARVQSRTGRSLHRPSAQVAVGTGRAGDSRPSKRATPKTTHGSHALFRRAFRVLPHHNRADYSISARS